MATEPAVQEVEEVAPDTVEVPERPHGARRLWSWLWPKLAALALFLAVWQVVVWSGWRPDYVLPGPIPVFQRLGQDLGRPDFYAGVAVTMRRAFLGYALAGVVGRALGLVVGAVPVVGTGLGNGSLRLQDLARATAAGRAGLRRRPAASSADDRHLRHRRRRRPRLRLRRPRHPAQVGPGRLMRRRILLAVVLLCAALLAWNYLRPV